MRGMRYSKHFLSIFVVVFCLFCAALVVESGVLGGLWQVCGPCVLLQKAEGEAAGVPGDGNDVVAEKEAAKIAAGDYPDFDAVGGPQKDLVLGSTDPESGYKYRLEMTSRGAAIRRAVFSEFDNRDPDDPQPLKIISEMPLGEEEVLSMSLADFRLFVDPTSELMRPFPLERMSWETFEGQTGSDGSQSVRFEATIKDDKGQPVVKLTKTFNIVRDSYLLSGEITVENLSDSEQKFKFNLTGPGGLGREAFRTDMRKVVAGYEAAEGKIGSARHDKKDLNKAKTLADRQLPVKDILWIAAVNKYFAAILVPEKQEGARWVEAVTGRLYNPDADSKANSGDEAVGFGLQAIPAKLGAKGEEGSSVAYKFQLYVGPKDKSFFDKNDLYRTLGFVETIDFMVCCCPGSIIKPLAFGILAIMKWMHGFWPHNYGIVIIILVFCVRLIMHPVTKKSQVSMSKMQKLAPRSEEIKKKYANNKAEMQKQMMALYREQGASPIMGFLPMMIQMPIWIALWSAVYASIDLRGASFLPFWITDLSMPDALFKFPAFSLPLLGKLDSFNLLPLLMGVAFYLQQKLMPKQGSAATNPQVAQQQKMMMIMMPLLFPLMLYKAPSGVNLYIMSSTFAGVIEQYVIRKHIREKDKAESQGLVSTTKKAGGKVKKKKPKPFFRT